MRPTRFANIKRERGVMLLEALIAILIFSIGILAVVGMQGVAIKDLSQAKYRSEAAFLTNQLMAQMWTDNGNINSYNFNGTGTVPTRLQDWVSRVTTGTISVGGVSVKVGQPLPGAAANPPKVTVTGATPNGGVVQIQIFWILPEELSNGLPPHNHTVIASVYTS